MEKIASFTIDHIKLQPGVYVSRKDKVGGSTVTTFDPVSYTHLDVYKRQDLPILTKTGTFTGE